MKKFKRYILLFFIIVLIWAWIVTKLSFDNKYTIIYPVWEKIDSLNDVWVYNNGFFLRTHGRNLWKDDYNIGIKYQCVEFVKRYYYEYLNHKMPDSYGHAKFFFDESVWDWKRNVKRNLFQYKNGSVSKPEVSDIIVWNGWIFNKYGHVAIVSEVWDDYIEVIQQNPWLFSSTRKRIELKLIDKGNKYYLDDWRILGWLRK